jgi:hypothetical protein
VTVRCPDGHESESTDYCDVCGLPVAGTLLGGSGAGGGPTGPYAGPGAGPGPAPAAPDAGLKPCPNCGFEALPGALFCEDCGYDFTTGALPPPLPSSGGGPLDLGPPPAPHSGTSGAVTTLLAPDEPTVGREAPAAGAGAPVAPGTPTWVAEVWVDPDWYATQESNDPCPSPGMPVVVPLDMRSVLVGRRSVSRNITPQIDCGSDSGVSRRHAQLTTDGHRWWIEDLQSSNGTYVGQAGGPLPTMPLAPGQKLEFTSGDRIYLGAWTRIVVRRATPDEFPA